MGFSSVTAQALMPGKTVELVLNQLVILGDSPVLIVEHMGESNREFWNDALAKASGTRAAEVALGGKLTADQVNAARARNREALIKWCVKGTKGFFHDFPDRPGVPDPDHPATDADTADIIMALPNEVFDSVSKFVQNAENFRDRPITGVPKVLAGKS
jgi:hypothetical protein